MLLFLPECKDKQTLGLYILGSFVDWCASILVFGYSDNGARQKKNFFLQNHSESDVRNVFFICFSASLNFWHPMTTHGSSIHRKLRLRLQFCKRLICVVRELNEFDFETASKHVLNSSWMDLWKFVKWLFISLGVSFRMNPESYEIWFQTCQKNGLHNVGLKVNSCKFSRLLAR